MTLNGAAELFFPASAINDGAVHYVAVTYDATTGDLAGYLDGELLGVLAAGPGRNFGDGGFLVLGEEQDLIGGGFDASQGLIGGLGQVNLWRRTLTEAEVDEAFAGDVNVADPDLAAAYRFNPSTNVFDDVTGGGNDLTSSGGISARAGVGVDATVEEEATLAFRSLFVGDVDALNGSGELTVTVSAANGVVELRTIAGLTITAGENNSASVTVQGAAADINATLARLDYRSDKDFVGADTITILVDDGLLAPQIDFAGATTVTANVTYALDFDTGQVTTENQFGATTPPTNGVVIVLNPNLTDFEVLAEVYENSALTNASTDFSLDGYLGTSGFSFGGQRFRFDDAFSNLTLTWSQPDVPSPTGPREVTFTFENISFADDGVNEEVTFSSGMVNSGAPARDEAVINLTVANVNDAPTAQDDALATDNDATLSGDLFADNGSGVDVDPDGDAITVTQIDGVAVTNGETVTLGSGAADDQRRRDLHL